MTDEGKILLLAAGIAIGAWLGWRARQGGRAAPQRGIAPAATSAPVGLSAAGVFVKPMGSHACGGSCGCGGAS